MGNVEILNNPMQLIVDEMAKFEAERFVTDEGVSGQITMSKSTTYKTPDARYVMFEFHFLVTPIGEKKVVLASGDYDEVRIITISNSVYDKQLNLVIDTMVNRCFASFLKFERVGLVSDSLECLSKSPLGDEQRAFDRFRSSLQNAGFLVMKSDSKAMSAYLEAKNVRFSEWSKLIKLVENTSFVFTFNGEEYVVTDRLLIDKGDKGDKA